MVLEEGKRYVVRAVTEVTPDDFGAIMFSGGLSPDFLRINPPPLQLVADAYNAGKVIAAICHSPQVLISVDPATALIWSVGGMSLETRRSRITCATPVASASTPGPSG